MKTWENTDFISKLIRFSEKILTQRARKIARTKARNKRRGVLIEWLDAFLWAVMVVLLLNQYLLQAYQIPSGSMRPTLIGGKDPYTGEQSPRDRIFVDKLTFGPELLPGLVKLEGFRKARRGEVIVFENPEYESPSVLHEIAQRILYMASLSFIDLNRRNGEIAHQFLIKRQVAEDGDRVIFQRGEVFLRPVGEAVFLPESQFKEFVNLQYGNNVLLDTTYYDNIYAKIHTLRYSRSGLDIDESLAFQATENWVSPLKKPLGDLYEEKRIDSKILNMLYPQNEFISESAMIYDMGIYVPENYVLPLGDNRSDSLDGRYFGPIPVRQILGRALIKYWPAQRMGIIR